MTDNKHSKTNDDSNSSDISNRGFASMDPDQQREIASQGGRAAHEKGTAHEFDSEEAAEAGRKGGQSRGSSASKENSSSTSARGKNNNNEDIISSNSLTEFNNELLKFCLESGIDYYSCSSKIQDSVQSAQFTSSYMGPSTVNTDLIKYSLELKIK